MQVSKREPLSQSRVDKSLPHAAPTPWLARQEEGDDPGAAAPLVRDSHQRGPSQITELV